MPSITISSSEVVSGSGVPTDAGTAFIAGLTDAGPTTYQLVQSLNQFTSIYGPRSAGSAILYDTLDEFFSDGGSQAFVVRVSDNTAASAALTLSDKVPHPTVVATALTAGLGGNGTSIAVVVANGPTFTATTASSTALTAISSFANIGVGTPISGAGIAANTYIAAVNVGASSATLSIAATATATGVTMTPSNFTVEVEDSAGDILETHGPYITTSQLFTDTSSTLVTFTQSASAGFTVNQPAAITTTALTGGADASDLTDANYVTALASFPVTLGPGQVAVPGKTTSTVWNGLLLHAQANNRFAALDMADTPTAATAVAAAAALTDTALLESYGMFIQGSLILPGIVPNTTRIVPGSAGVLAARAQVEQTPNSNTAPAGQRFPLNRPNGFTQYFGTASAVLSGSGAFSQADVNTMAAGGVNCFASFFGVNCLFGFRTLVAPSTDAIYWQAKASTERMALTADCTAAMAVYLFDDIVPSTLTAMHTDLAAVCQAHYTAGALGGPFGSASEAFAVATDSPVNTNATAQAGQLNASLDVKFSTFAETVNISINVVPLSQSV